MPGVLRLVNGIGKRFNQTRTDVSYEHASPRSLAVLVKKIG